MLSKVSKDHHFYELSGKTLLPKVRYTLVPLLAYLIINACRVFVVALLTAYLRFWAAVPLAVFLLLNWPLTRILRTDWTKNIWTTFSSVVTPVCFVSRWV